MELSPGTMVNANVRLVELLGTGGMGSVWLADHLGLDARVAVKLISPALVQSDRSLAERFKREASICARIRSVHVVQTFDHGVMEDGRPYIVMELLEGCTLTDRVESGGPLQLREVGMVVAQVAKVLHRAHALGIVHRDVKPDNIFVTDSDYELFVKVLDFGIAKQVRSGGHNEPVTKTGAVVGTLEFMSPEQAISSKTIDHRSDLFSLAVVAYYALTGELPYDMNAQEPLWLQMTSGKNMPASLHRNELRPEVDQWFDKALQPKPDQRFQTAREMADALRIIIAAHGLGGADGLGSSIDDSLSLSSEGMGMREDSFQMPAAQLGAVEDSSLFFAPRSRPHDDDSQPAMYDLLGPDSEGMPNEVTLLMDAADHQQAEVEGEGPPTQPRPKMRFSPSSSRDNPPRSAVYDAVRNGVYNSGLDGAYNAEVASPTGSGAAAAGPVALPSGPGALFPGAPSAGMGGSQAPPAAASGSSVPPASGATASLSGPPTAGFGASAPETPPWMMAHSRRGVVRRWWPALLVLAGVGALVLLVLALAR